MVVFGKGPDKIFCSQAFSRCQFWKFEFGLPLSDLCLASYFRPRKAALRNSIANFIELYNGYAQYLLKDSVMHIGGRQCFAAKTWNKERDVVYFMFLSRINYGKEASASLLLLYVILYYGFGQEQNDSRLCSCNFCFQNKVHIISRIYKSQFTYLSRITQGQKYTIYASFSKIYYADFLGYEVHIK